MTRRWAQGAVAALLGGICVAAQAQPDAAVTDGSRDAKTIQLLLQLQGSASAPSAGRAAGELPPLRGTARRDGAAPEEHNPFAIRPDPALANARHVPLSETHVEPAEPPSDRPQRSATRSMDDTMERAPDVGRFLPIGVLRFVRENREIVIALSLGVLVLLAVAGAAAGSGAKRR